MILENHRQEFPDMRPFLSHGMGKQIGQFPIENEAKIR